MRQRSSRSRRRWTGRQHQQHPSSGSSSSSTCQLVLVAEQVGQAEQSRGTAAGPAGTEESLLVLPTAGNWRGY